MRDGLEILIDRFSKDNSLAAMIDLAAISESKKQKEYLAAHAGPELKPLLDQMQKEKDWPIKKTVSMYKLLKRLSGIEHGLADQLDEDSIKSRGTRVSQADIMGEHLFYSLDNILKMADAISQTAAERNVPIYAVIKNQDYMDQATKKAFPTRESYNENMECSFKLGREGLARNAASLSKGEKLVAQGLSFEAPLDQMARLETVIRQYHQEKCDRIYGIQQSA